MEESVVELIHYLEDNTDVVDMFDDNTNPRYDFRYCIHGYVNEEYYSVAFSRCISSNWLDVIYSNDTSEGNKALIEWLLKKYELTQMLKYC